MGRQFMIIGCRQSLYGLSTILRTEGISFQKGATYPDSKVSLFDIEEIKEEFELPINSKLLITFPSLKDCKQAQRLVEKVFGVSCNNIMSARKGILRFNKGAIFEKISSLLDSFGLSEVLVPLNGMVAYDILSNAEVLAEIEVEGVLYPAVILKDGNFLVAFDIGGCLLSLLTEGYFKSEEEKKALSPVANHIYKIAPYNLRLAIYRNYLKSLRKQRAKSSYFTTSTPIEAAGWTLCQILIGALDYSLGFLPRIWKWPGTSTYAFCFTHDIEPRKYAYYQGLPKLLNTLRELNLKSTISLVSEPPFVLPEDSLNKLEREEHEVISHGLFHNGTFSTISSSERASRIEKSRRILASIAGVEVKGFRAPWLQRTNDLGRLLEGQGFSFDSSFIDTDTSLKKSWHGKGISFNFPFRLFSNRGEIKEYKVLELPLTGPQDMEPYFSGLNVNEYKAVFRQKHEWVRNIGGLYVFLVHAGVYGERDSKMRIDLLQHLFTLVEKQDVWITRLGEVSQWWLQREDLKIDTVRTRNPGELSFEVKNQGEEKVYSFSVAICPKFKIKEVCVGERLGEAVKKSEQLLIPVTELEAGGKIKVRLTGDLE